MSCDAYCQTPLAYDKSRIDVRNPILAVANDAIEPLNDEAVRYLVRREVVGLAVRGPNRSVPPAVRDAFDEKRA